MINNHIDDLRSLFHHYGIDGYIQPHTDEFQNEYLPPSAERIAYVSDFTGSAGRILIGYHFAHLFTDGRYTIQSRLQVDPNIWGTAHFDKFIEIVKQKIPIGSIIGYYPFFFTVRGYKKLVQDLPEYHFVPTSDLIGKIWKNKPANPSQKPNVYPIAFAGETAEHKIHSATEQIRFHRADYALITQPDTIAWILNIRGHDIPYLPVFLSYMIISKTGDVTVFTYEERLKETSEILACTVLAFDRLPQFFKQLQGSVVFDPDTCPYGLYKLMKENNIQDIVAREVGYYEKAIKNRTEIKGAHYAHLQEGIAWIHLWYTLDKKRHAWQFNEYAVGQLLASYRTHVSTYKEDSFAPIVGSGANGAIAHYIPTATNYKAINPYEPLLIDSGGQYLQGTTDTTRTLALSDQRYEIKRVYTFVLKAHLFMMLHRFQPSMEGHQIDAQVRSVLQQGGYRYAHGTGHGVGAYLSVHEGPYHVSFRDSLPIPPNVFITDEPGFYREGHFGIRIENVCITVQDSNGLTFESLTMIPYEQKLILYDLLTIAEIHWLNAYHKRVLDTVGPYLIQSDMRNWLAEKCLPHIVTD